MSARSQLSITTPADSYDLISLSDVKDDWGISVATDDAFLSRSISRCSQAAAQFCNRVFPVETVVESFEVERDTQPMMNFGGVDPLQLTRWPIQTIGPVVEGTGAGAVTLALSADYLLDAARGFLIRLDGDGNPKNWPAKQTSVTYAAGFPSIPLDIQDAVSRMVWTRYAERKRDPFIKRQRVYGVEEVEYVDQKNDGNLSSDISDILDNYRVPVVAR